MVWLWVESRAAGNGAPLMSEALSSGSIRRTALKGRLLNPNHTHLNPPKALSDHPMKAWNLRGQRYPQSYDQISSLPSRRGRKQACLYF